ncbi:MAG: TrkH family potassium uptake protein [Ruminococcus flavefaciens]|nr:TrkH family potassium uptake protein [Ruminococcus flavefaciens]
MVTGYRLINSRGIVRLLAYLLLFEAGFMLIPLLVSIYYGENDYYGFLVAILFTLLVSCSILTGVDAGRRDLGRREGYLLTALVWVVFSFFGMIPFMSTNVSLGFTDAFCETMSGFTTTGCSVLSDVENLSHGIHIWRCLMQWVGGLGIMIFTLAVLPMLNSSGGMQMMNAELPGITKEKLSPRVSQTAKRLWLVYLALTMLLAVLLCLGPMDIFDGICHALSTMSTGGFSTRNDSIGAWDSWYIRLVILLFMFIGGVNFALIYRASIGKFRASWHDETFRLYVKVIIVVTILLIIGYVVNCHPAWSANVIVDPLFQVVSTVTSTGFAVTDYQSWGAFVFPILLVLMFVGASAGSTSGGCKLDRVAFLFKNCRNEINKCIHPNRVYSVAINGRVQSPELVSKVISFLWLYMGLIIGGGMLLVLMGMPISDSLFAALSCVGNTGLGAGVTADSFVDVPTFGKWVLSFLMLVGRLEIFTVLVLITRNFWRK